MLEWELLSEIPCNTLYTHNYITIWKIKSSRLTLFTNRSLNIPDKSCLYYYSERLVTRFLSPPVKVVAINKALS